MTQTSANRQALMKAIKQELRQRLWEDRHDSPTYGRYRSLFVMNPEPMWVYDTKTLGILDVNEAAVGRYGYTRDEFFRLTIKDLRPQEDVPKFLELTQQLPSSDRTGPWRHRLKTGDVIQVLITSHAIRYGGRPARIVMAEQLTGESEIDAG
jgi:two-component system cell cycle sensor histidine kinase/response regulator CckA